MLDSREIVTGSAEKSVNKKWERASSKRLMKRAFEFCESEQEFDLELDKIPLRSRKSLRKDKGYPLIKFGPIKRLVRKYEGKKEEVFLRKFSKSVSDKHFFLKERYYPIWNPEDLKNYHTCSRREIYYLDSDGTIINNKNIKCKKCNLLSKDSENIEKSTFIHREYIHKTGGRYCVNFVIEFLLYTPSGWNAYRYTTEIYAFNKSKYESLGNKLVVHYNFPEIHYESAKNIMQSPTDKRVLKFLEERKNKYRREYEKALYRK